MRPPIISNSSPKTKTKNHEYKTHFLPEDMLFTIALIDRHINIRAKCAELPAESYNGGLCTVFNNRFIL